MSLLPHGRSEWTQQLKLAVFCLAMFGCVLFLLHGLDTGLGVYRKPTFCWISACFAFLAFLAAEGPRRRVALAALVVAVLGSVYGYYANNAWREKLERVQAQESACAFSNSRDAA
ncbi:MAG: hypothetical protein H7A46_22915 [Verrucomicrobiales bacterium]|nr:hypothetical protein [Verrucomicrobiales bacterium]